MPHFRVDDALHGHPKAQRAGDDAIGMWVRAGSFCMAYLTDGFVPDWWVRQQPKGVAKAKRLIAAGLWHGGAERDGEKGYQFHEFTGPGRQDSRAQIEADREKWRKKKAAQRAASPGESPGDNPQVSQGDRRNGRTQKHATQRTVQTQYNERYVDENTHAENAATSATTQMSPGESRVLPNTNPTKEISTHLKDDSHVSNAHDPDDYPLPPEPEPDDDYGPVPQHVDNAARPTPRQPSQAAKTVVRQTLGSDTLAAYPRTFVDRLARRVEDLTREGQPDALIRQALIEWDKRPDARPEWLDTVLGDIVKNQRAQPGHNNGGRPVHKMRGLAELAQEVRAQEQQAAIAAETTNPRKELTP
ncbi:hypothetical protein A5784_14015 [Mycobacterium sp. 852013-50091_SCH5140682]|uniref:hypothetical protein n=1 Tax=Mycobacterium sp. 852013-50091_SCH5140682 TaxID=1834109 RepID=UPI0007EA1B49|nr:hypothetical protein [Mycobacterium sp. 852013-50091_SCH5140682]OBC03350.1 hypothetical protein A5784_14015 [Mycobacterium sp. 852013-50091_SCH5140682]